MKTEQEQIEQIEKVLKDSVADYKHLKKKGVCYCYAETLIDHGYGDISEYKAEIEQLKDNHAKLQELFAKYQLASDKEIRAQVKQAKIDVLNELKKKTHNYYPSIDSYCISQHVVLVRDIDELIKEVENEQ